MMRELLRSVLDIVDDPHEFAEAFVAHVTRTGHVPDVAAAAWAFVRSGRVS